MDGDVDIYVLHHLLSRCCSFMSPSYAYRFLHTRICQSLYLKRIRVNGLRRWEGVSRCLSLVIRTGPTIRRELLAILSSAIPPIKIGPFAEPARILDISLE
jgi:hypothetical protein